MKFTKMQGLGNDYIYIDAFEERVDDPPALARRLSDRHFGVGGDGLVLKGVENTIRNISRLGRVGMRETDREIIRMMVGEDKHGDTE